MSAVFKTVVAALMQTFIVSPQQHLALATVLDATTY
jgi:hypothetical protein